MIDLTYILLSQQRPKYPGRHVQRYPVDPLIHDPLFRHGEDEQMSNEIVKIQSGAKLKGGYGG